MRIYDIACPSCGSHYEVAESASVRGSPGRVECTVCRGLVDSWQEPKKKVHRWQNGNIRAFLRRRRRRFLRSLDSKQDSSKPSKPPASRLGCLFDLLVNSPVSPTQFLEDHSANPTCLAVSPANLILPFGPFDEGSVTHDTAQRFRKGLSASSSDL